MGFPIAVGRGFAADVFFFPLGGAPLRKKKAMAASKKSFVNVLRAVKREKKNAGIVMYARGEAYGYSSVKVCSC